MLCNVAIKIYILPSTCEQERISPSSLSAYRIYRLAHLRCWRYQHPKCRNIHGLVESLCLGDYVRWHNCTTSISRLERIDGNQIAPGKNGPHKRCPSCTALSCRYGGRGENEDQVKRLWYGRPWFGELKYGPFQEPPHLVLVQNTPRYGRRVKVWNTVTLDCRWLSVKQAWLGPERRESPDHACSIVIAHLDPSRLSYNQMSSDPQLLFGNVFTYAHQCRCSMFSDSQC